MSRFSLAKDRLQADVVNVVRDLFGPANAKERDRKRNLWNITNPWRAKAHSGQMCVWLSGARNGAWKDFVSGDKGDIIDLVAYAREGIVHRDSRMRAVEWAEDRYRIREMDPESARMASEAADKRRRQVREQEDRRRASSRDRARRMYFSAEAEIRGTLVETYLASRGILINDIPNLEPLARFFPAAEYWLGAPRSADGRKLGNGPLFPAMVNAMVAANGNICACHLTFLATDGRGKAPVDKAKLMWPETAGFVMRVTRGPTGLSAEDEAAAGGNGWIGITEGYEDAATVGLVRPDLRCWAAGSLSGLLHVPDHEAARGYLVFRDNDWGKPQARQLFDRAIARLRAFRKPVEAIAMPPDWGKDVNDALNFKGDPS